MTEEQKGKLILGGFIAALILGIIGGRLLIAWVESQ